MTERRIRGFGVLACAMALACGDDGTSDDGGDTAAASSGAATSAADDTTAASDDSTGASGIMVSGDAFAFALPGTPYGRLDGATVSVLEQPEFSVTSDADGHFVFESLPPGSTATFRIERDGFPIAHTKTFTLPESGELPQVTFQVPDDTLFDALATLLMLEVDPSACQIVSTVTRVGKSLYDEGAHGEGEALVTIDPPLPAEHGPIYFNEMVIPDPTLTESSEDGGVLFVNVPPGTYTMTATKAGVTFESTTMQCEAGVLVNASPPYGLQAL